MVRLLWIILLTAFASYGSALPLSDKESYSLEGHLSYLEDPSGSRTFSEIKTSTFTPYKGSNVNFGFSRSVYWFRFDIQQDRFSAQKRWWLSIPYPLLEKVDIYTTDKLGNLLSHQNVGSALPFVSRELPIRDFTAELFLKDHSDTTVIIRVQTQSSMQVPLSIYSSEGLFQEVETKNLATGLYYGIFIIILLYNSVLYFYTRDQNYLRYIFFLFTLVLWQLSFDGIGVEYLWCDTPWIIQHGSSFWIAMTAFSALYFSRRFLNTAHFAPTMDRIIWVVKGFSLLMAAASLILPYGDVIVINAALATIIPIILFITGIIVMRQNYRPARFYVAGWSSFLVATLIFAFNKFDLIPSFYGVNHFQQIGSAIEMIFLSLALADRVHLLQKEYVEKLNHLNDTLTEKVDQALTEVRKKDQLFVQQSRLAALGEMIEQIAHQWRQPLNTLALINQDLYVKYKLGICDEGCFDNSHAQIDEHLQYLSKTIDDFRNFYKTDKSKHSEDIAGLVSDALRLSEVFLKYAKIKTVVHANATLKVNIAKNEMIQVLMNLIKNAHDAIIEQGNRNGMITIGLEDDVNSIRVSVEDNAGGISPNIMEKIFDIYFTTKDPDHGTGLGLHMSKYIIEESFGGKIWVENTTEGARFVIILPAVMSDT